MTCMAYDWRGDFGPRVKIRKMGRHRDAMFGPWGFGGGPGFGGPPHGRRWRAGRGDVRAAILLLLDEEPRNGYALMQEIEERSEGVWRPSPGSVYPALAQLEDEGLVRAQAEGSGSGRTFELTDTGRSYVEERREELGEPWAAVAGGFPKEGLELGKEMKQLAGAVAQVMRAGDEEQRRRAIELMSETRRALYRMLAEEGSEG